MSAGSKASGTEVHYVAQVKEVKPVGQVFLRHLRIKDHFKKDTFGFPVTTDEGWVDSDIIVGVLTQVKGTTKRQQNSVVKIFPSLESFNMR